jgi:hypothetical protein
VRDVLLLKEAVGSEIKMKQAVELQYLKIILHLSALLQAELQDGIVLLSN